MAPTTSPPFKAPHSGAFLFFSPRPPRGCNSLTPGRFGDFGVSNLFIELTIPPFFSRCNSTMCTYACPVTSMFQPYKHKSTNVSLCFCAFVLIRLDCDWWSRWISTYAETETQTGYKQSVCSVHARGTTTRHLPSHLAGTTQAATIELVTKSKLAKFHIADRGLCP